MTPAIQQDAALTNDYPDALDENTFMTALFDGAPEEGDDASKKKPSDTAPNEDDQETPDADEGADETSEETPEDEDADDEGEGAEENEEGDEPDTAAKKFADGDDTYVKIKVGEEEHEVKVSDLKRLWGQEASLTRKSQEVAAERTTIDNKRAENIAAYDVLLKRATERADKYRALPWTQLMKDPNVPAEQLQALQAEAGEALQDEQFLKSELGNFMQKVQAEQIAAQRTAAQECLKAINNPESPHHIKGWTDTLYNELRTFGSEMGIPADTVNQITDPGAIKILHMAMQFKRGASKVVTKKVNKTPTKIVKNSASSPAARGTASQVAAKTAVKKAVSSGSLQDAANAFEALMGD